MDVKTTAGRTLAVALTVALTGLAVPRVQAAPHLVSPNDMAARLVEQASSRQEKVELFQKALAVPEVREKAKSMGVDAERLSRAIPHLTDQELADLAQRATKAEDVAAGHHGHDGDAALVLIGVALLVAGIIILAAVLDEYDYYDDYYWDDCCYW
jgi:pyruvate/2-oxoglutarate dehydrogenase complex dihydrolipoamide acyltransferase (E2) component